MNRLVLEDRGHDDLCAAAGPHRAWTPAQLTAIRSRARTLVTAAAGSGKTSVLTELVAQALQARELAPSQVCAVTFTEKAAQEMRGRISDRLVELGERDLLAELELARIGTIHSLCASILRRHGAAVGIDPGAGQLDEAQHAWILRDANVHVLAELGEDADVHWLRARVGDERIESILRGLHHCACQADGIVRLVDPQDAVAVLDPKSGEAIVDAADARRSTVAIHRLWERFHGHVERRKQVLGRISFDDLERLAVEAVRLPAVRADLRARWGMLLVDEFQDTNARQYELLDAIGADRLFMVGDEWQSIYRFRGADVDVFRARRESSHDGVVVPMRENFRSAAPVLDVVNHVFSHERLFGSRYEPVHAGTEAQRVVEGPAVELLVVPDCPVEGADACTALASREREAARVAERVARLVGSGAAEPGDVALLYARGTGVDLYERALHAWGLPVLRAASSGYYDQRDVRDVLALLAAVRNGHDDLATLAVLAGPIGRLDWTELDSLAQRARDAGSTLQAAASSSELQGARRAVTAVEDLREHARGGSLVQVLSRAVTLPELEVGAASASDGVLRLANLRRLVELAASAEQVGVRSVAGFLEFVEAQRRDARVGEASVADESVGAVRLLTVHASKGLEFPHVFVIEAASRDGARSDVVPSPLQDEHGVVHVPVPQPDGRCTPTRALAELRDLDERAEREESLRLWYVAMTRARDRLYISGRWNFEPTRAGKPRAVAGALQWLRTTLELPDDFGGVDRTHTALEGLVLVDTRPARARPRPIWESRQQTVTLARPLSLPAGPSAPSAATAVPDPHALRERLREGLDAHRSSDGRQLDGIRLHDAVARLLDASRGASAAIELLDPSLGPWMTPSVRRRLEPVVDSAVFARLADLGARSEVPYLASRGAVLPSRAVPGADVVARVADVDAGRMDALAVLEDGAWWIVDWKLSVPADPSAAWALHGEQLARYARAARSSGAPCAIVTLAPLDRPAATISWTIGADGAATLRQGLP